MNKKPKLFVTTETEIKDIRRIKIFDKHYNFISWFIAIPLLTVGVLIALFVIFFQITNLLEIKEIPRIPALGLFVLPGMVAVASGIGAVNTIVRSPIREFIRKPDHFWIIKAVISNAERSKTGKTIKLTIHYDSPYDPTGEPEQFQTKIKARYWDKEAILPLEAWIIHNNNKQTGEKGLLGILKK